MHKIALMLMVLLGAVAWADDSQTPEAEDPPEVQLGELLFNESRFSQFFYSRFAGVWNTALGEGDPTLERLTLAQQNSVEHPHRGRSMSCASCHFVDQAVDRVERGVRLYNDFAAVTPVPLREDKQIFTVRNSSHMVGSSSRLGLPLHWDGEFFDSRSLAAASLVGRNMGWTPDEAKAARQHIVNVVRRDDGHFLPEGEARESYRELFAQMPEPYTLDIESADDRAVFTAVTRLLSAYMDSLDFQHDERGQYFASAYDKFMALNGLSPEPQVGQSTDDYVEYLQSALRQKRQGWTWVAPEPLKYHESPSQFSQLELEGFRIFVGKAQCVRCHTPPHFTDSGFHNVGVEQFAYERMHGRASFLRLNIPKLAQRSVESARYLVASEADPTRQGILRRQPERAWPEYADLGAWNILFHPDMTSVQTPLKSAICRSLILDCAALSDEELLDRSVALFKTPSLRSLGQSAPYFHNGMARDLMEVMVIYVQSSVRGRSGQMRNLDSRVLKMDIKGRDLRALEAFLKSLNEDYD